MVVVVQEEHQVCERADHLSHGTEIGSVVSGAKPCHATDVQTVPGICHSIEGL
jgi:hypothetical protein